MLRRRRRGEAAPSSNSSPLVDLTHIDSDDDTDGGSLCLVDDELDGQPRIITSVDGYQSLSTPLIATLSQKEVKVTVKWKQPRINGHRQSKRIKVAKSSSQVDTLSHDHSNPEQYSPSDKFAIGESVFAWDRGHLYKAKVLKSKDVNGELEYYIHYSGYKKGHRRWLSCAELIKVTSSSTKFYDDQITLTEDVNQDVESKTMKSRYKAQPDNIMSKHPTVEEETYDEDDYKSLHQRYLMPRIREKVELPGGRMLRRQCKGRMIDQKNSKGFQMLRIKVDSLLKKNRHGEVYMLLCQLRNWELDPRRIPAVFKECGDEAVKEVLDLTKEDEEEDGSGNTCIDVDDFITDVLLPSHTPSSSSLPECPTSGVMQVRSRRVSPDQSTKASSDNSDIQESVPASLKIRVKKERAIPPAMKRKKRRSNPVKKKNKGKALKNKPSNPQATGQEIHLTYGALEEVELFVYSVIETVSKDNKASNSTSRPRQSTSTINTSNPQGIDLYSKNIKWDDIPKPPGQLTIDECRRFYVKGGAKRHARHQGRSQHSSAHSQQFPHQQSLLAQHNMRLQQYTTQPSQYFALPPNNHQYNTHPRQQTLLAQQNMMLPQYTSPSHQYSTTPHQQDYSSLAQQMLFQMIDGVSVPSHHMASQHVSLLNVPTINTIKPQVVTPDTKQKSSRSKKRKLPTNNTRKKLCPSKAETQHRLLVKDFGFPPCQKTEVDETRSSTLNRITKRELKSYLLDSFHPPSNKRLRRLQKVRDHPNLTPTFNILPQTRMLVPPKPIIDCTISLKDGWNRQNAVRRTGKWTPAGHLTGKWKAPDWAIKSSTKSSTVPSSKGCKKSLLPQLDSLMTNFMIEVEMEHIPEKPRPFKSLQDVKCPIYAKLNTLRSAHHAVQQLLPAGDCEDWEVVELARKYYNYWRPKETKVILLAESHAFTTKDRAFEGPGLDESILPEYKGPRGFLSLVYCLGYGENDALAGQEVDKSNKGTPQFWTLFAACSRGVDHVAVTNNTKTKCASPFAADLLKGGGLPVEERLKAKLEVLEDLKRRGIWLLDASIFGWFISQPQIYTRSSVSNEVHRKPKSRPPLELKAPSLVLSWELFTKHLVRHVADEGQLKLLIPIGMEVEAALTRHRLEEAVQGKSQARVTDTFPAPNAWIPGGYHPFHAKLAALVHEAAPRVSVKEDAEIEV